MKIQHTLIALAVLGMGAAAQAAPVTPADALTATNAGNAVYVSGSSALRFSLASGFVSMCQAGTIAVFGNTNGTAPGNNVRGYACTLAKDIKPSTGGTTAFSAGTNVVFNKYDAGGSINGIQPLVKNTALAYLSYGACTATGLVRSGTFDLTKVDYACTQGNNVVPQMGVSDVEAATIQHKNNLATGTTAVATSSLNGGAHSVAMAGIAVNLPLYRALQAAQGLNLDDTEASAPTLPIGFLTTVLTGSASPLLDTGFTTVIKTSAAAGHAINLCTRANGSGTKAMVNSFLLNNPCSSTGALTPAGTASPNASVGEIGNNDMVLNVATSTGNVIACMQAASTDTSSTSTGLAKDWAIGIVGSENDPGIGGTDAGWRFVKVGGFLPNQANGQTGAYPMTYENYMYWPKTGLAAKFSQFANWLQRDAVTPLALSATPDAGTRKGILSIADITDSAFASVTGYIARTTRNGNSCTPQQIVQ